MARVVLMVLGMVAGLFVGIADAGEEAIMAMRGNSPEGVVSRNLMRLPSVGDGAQPASPEPFERAMPKTAPDAGDSLAAVPETPAFMRWRESRDCAPTIVAGRMMKLEHSGGFGLTPRFVDRPETETTGFLGELFGELAQN